MPRRLASDSKWAAEESVEANATRVLPAMARDYFAAGRKMAAAKPGPAELHPFRLKTKQIRYTLEGFQGFYGEPIVTLLEKLKPVQDALGDVNDAVATRKEFDLGVRFEGFLRRRARAKAKDFFKAWKKRFDVAGEEEKWMKVLSQTETAVDSHNLAGDEIRGGEKE